MLRQILRPATQRMSKTRAHALLDEIATSDEVLGRKLQMLGRKLQTLGRKLHCTKPS
ncbi:MAG: hypothetical protein ACI85K_000775 [Hyphomicrobiaceae bacterium]|jgi:hypothetical protein